MYYIFFLFRQLSLSLSPPISYFGNTIAKNQTIFFFFFLLFWQCHCHKLIATIFFFPTYFANGIATNSLPQFFFPPISAMPLPQTNCNNFFFPPISAIPLPQINCHFFFFLIGEMICAHHRRHGGSISCLYGR